MKVTPSSPKKSNTWIINLATTGVLATAYLIFSQIAVIWCLFPLCQIVLFNIVVKTQYHANIHWYLVIQWRSDLTKRCLSISPSFDDRRVMPFLSPEFEGLSTASLFGLQIEFWDIFLALNFLPRNCIMVLRAVSSLTSWWSLLIYISSFGPRYSS
jgi:hypothetical protein